MFREGKSVLLHLLECYILPSESCLLFSRYGNFDKLRQNITQNEGGLGKFSLSFTSFGIHFNEDNSIYCKEWAPNVHKLYLYGDFSKLHLLLCESVITYQLTVETR